MSFAKINRQYIVVYISVAHSNPNGDPDNEGRPRTLLDLFGLISPTSFASKFRRLVAAKDMIVWETFAEKLKLDPENYYVFESRDNEEIVDAAKREGKVFERFVDVRLRGVTHLPKTKKETESSDEESSDASSGKKKPKGKATAPSASKDLATEQTVSRGPLQISVAQSLHPVVINEYSETKMRPTSEDNKGGYATLGDKRVVYGLYEMTIAFDPASVNPQAYPFIEKDMKLFLGMLPRLYQWTASKVRNDVSIVRAYHIEHKSPLGSEQESRMREALRPTSAIPATESATSINDYKFKTVEEFKNHNFRIHSVVDLADSSNWDF